MSVSISILEADIKLVSIPRSAVRSHMYQITRCLAFKHQLAHQKNADPFFNITLNAVELSMFADATLVDKVFSESEATDDYEFEVSEDTWVALQVEGHDENDSEMSGIRIRDVSAPLAAAGISILFLSTYISDFILIKRHRLELVISILEKEHFMSADGDESTSSHVGRSESPYFAPLEQSTPSVTPGSSREFGQFPRSLTRHSSSVTSSRERHESSSSASSPSKNDAITSSLASSSEVQTGSRTSSLSRSRPVLGELTSTNALPAETLSPTSLSSPALSPARSSISMDLADATHNQPRSFEKMQESMLSESSTASGIVERISLLPDETVCVGLNMQQEMVWRTRIVHALFYPEDVLPRRFPSSHPTPRLGNLAESDHADLGYDSSALSPRSSSRQSQTQLFSTTPTPARPSVGTESTFTPTRSFSASTTESGTSLFQTTEDAEYPTPFISLTVTAEGGSLMTDIRLLRALFADTDESVVYAPGGGLSEMWSGELDEDQNSSDGDYDDLPTGLNKLSVASGRGRPIQRLDSGRERHTFDDASEWQQVAKQTGNGNTEDEEEEEEKRLFASDRRLYKCLQLDLSDYGLEKAGLAHQFASLITKEKINLLYSATFRTANILVAKRHIRKARRALESASR